MRRAGIAAANGLQLTGLGLVPVAGFLLADWVGVALTGAALILAGVALEREVT